MGFFRKTTLWLWCSLILLPALWGQNPSSAPASGVPLRILVVSTAAEAQQIATQLKKGDDFAVLAKEKSTDPTAESGGYMGIMDPAMLRPELRDAVASLKAGDVSAIIHIPSGYAIVKVLSPYSVAEMESWNRERQAAVSATGSVKYTPNVSGIGEAESALFRSPKSKGWGQDLRQVCESRKQTYANAVT